MKIIKDNFLISPSDLNNFVACKFTIKNEIKFHKKEITKISELLMTSYGRNGY